MLLGRHRRRDFARAALVVWVVGFELVPGLHLLLHEYLSAHDHGPVVRTGPSKSAEKRTASATSHHDGHRHDGVSHSHEGAPAGDHAPRPDSPAPSDPDHGANSLAHRMLAAVETPPPAVPDPGQLALVPRAPAPPVIALRSAAPLRPSVRGPPPPVV